MKPTTAISFAVVVAAYAAISDVSAFGCKPDEVKGWMASCDSIAGTSQSKCDNRACHTALHRLVEQETLDCYASSGLGPSSDLARYKTLDDFCHGEGPDPSAPTPAPIAVAPTTQPPPTSPVPSTSATTAPATPLTPSTSPAPATPSTPSTSPAPATPSTPSTSPAPATPSPSGSVPVVSPKPQC